MLMRILRKGPKRAKGSNTGSTCAKRKQAPAGNSSQDKSPDNNRHCGRKTGSDLFDQA
ncbi:hypothetical protein [Brucella pinnipedialis]|uniref:hypothetical protein n=1 Tax=Brucella pinnipedialis TaxID=120576 RepID=UPI0001B48106|nr:hypothetical protein [Brucella pinnipedialis]